MSEAEELTELLKAGVPAPQEIPPEQPSRFVNPLSKLKNYASHVGCGGQILIMASTGQDEDGESHAIVVCTKCRHHEILPLTLGDDGIPNLEMPEWVEPPNV